MLRRILIAAAVTVALAGAQEAVAPPPTEQEQIRDFLTITALALRDGPASAFLALFDPKAPGFAQISKDIGRTLPNAMLDSKITVVSDEGGESSRALQLDWVLTIASHDTSSGVTTRPARVSAKLERRDGKWLLTAFAPADFFRAGPGTQAWDLLSSASSQLRNGSAEGFLSDIDRKMPGYDRLAQSINGLVTIGQVDSSLELMSNEGTDTDRALAIDWTFSISQGVFGGRPKNEGNVSTQRHETVHVKVSMQGKKWRITSIEPLTFFEATAPVR